MTNRSDSSDAVFEALLGDIHRMQPSELPQLLQSHRSELGAENVFLYLADVQQERLTMMPDGSAPAHAALPIDSTVAGWVYRTLVERVTTGESRGLTLWLPLVDGIERLGVLCIEADTLDEEALRRCRTLSTIVTLVLYAKGVISDLYARSQRTQQMKISAEMLRAFLPPRSIGTRLTTSSAILEPAYNLGGDAFDHAVVDHTLHATIVDGMGHDLSAGLSSSVALAASRNTRRSDPTAELEPLVHSVDQALSDVFDDRHATAVFAHLHLDTGALEWINAGHPPPLLMRGTDLVPEALEREPEPPLGLPAGMADSKRTVQRAHLQPGDRVLLYTDGIIDAKDDSGQRFGLTRFTDFLMRAMAADEPPPEALRRLIKTLLAYQHGGLTDDATVMMFQWHPASSPDYFT
ncbi:PP2C family protein-serine/threonine phosphatase [Streptomyces sulphureus]|uniref:PP2C family protein-serine/threonine phosphatase n=1 Tax=Streptomyces sulphureus TaxID=47758 RepID=UPI00035D8321|nr:PP2C family protein-serine/threonine phosphatase [Streptomyces sulphureus]